MIAFLKKAESDPSILKKTVVYAGGSDFNKNEYFKPSKVLDPEKSYTIEDLLERMIVESDNNALSLLYQNIDAKELGEVYTDLGLSIPENESESLTDFMSVKAYANFFRVLYNAFYLDREMSEKSLGWLSQSTFSLGLRGGVPEAIPIAKKFGERNFSNNTYDPRSLKEVHDCGIIYFPAHPYLLCVMTKGKDYEKLTQTIKEISTLAYGQMASDTKK